MRKVLSLWRGEMLVREPVKSMQEILDDIVEAYGVSRKDITGRSCFQEHVKPRHHAMWLMSMQEKADGSPRYSLPQIAKALNRKDHTSVIHGIKRHAERSGLTYVGRKANQPRWTYEVAA